jgi:hypothetical protein
MRILLAWSWCRRAAFVRMLDAQLKQYGSCVNQSLPHADLLTRRIPCRNTVPDSSQKMTAVIRNRRFYGCSIIRGPLIANRVGTLVERIVPFRSGCCWSMRSFHRAGASYQTAIETVIYANSQRCFRVWAAMRMPICKLMQGVVEWACAGSWRSRGSAAPLAKSPSWVRAPM